MDKQGLTWAVHSSLAGWPLHLGLVAPYRVILRYYRCDTPDRTIPSQVGKMVGCPPCFLVSQRCICAIPHLCYISRDNRAISHKTSTKEFCDTMATNIARYEKYRLRASYHLEQGHSRKKRRAPKSEEKVSFCHLTAHKQSLVFSEPRMCLNSFRTNMSGGLLGWGSGWSRQVIYVGISPLFQMYSGPPTGLT